MDANLLTGLAVIITGSSVVFVVLLASWLPAFYLKLGDIAHEMHIQNNKK